VLDERGQLREHGVILRQRAPHERAEPLDGRDRDDGLPQKERAKARILAHEGDRALLAVAARIGGARLIDNVVLGDDPAPVRGALA
jgi:pantothenate synthetase